MLIRKFALSTLVTATIGSVLGQTAAAAATEQEAKQLGGKLTQFGAEKARNADGSIPEYTGGLRPPAGYKSGVDERYIDPYKDEKPLYTIDVKNVSQHAALLPEGTKAMIAKFPGSFKVNVYPTHRTVSYPSWVLENTVKNATTVKLVGEVEGDGVSGSAPDGRPWPGVPFPIPKSGFEVMWNYNLHLAPAVDHNSNSSWFGDASGNVSSLPSANQVFIHPWYEKTGQFRKETYGAFMGLSSRMFAPPSSAGIHFLNYYLPDSAHGGQKVWFYTPGQRRVRAAPEFAYDIPIAGYGGGILWDDIFGFTGRLDRFDFKLVGKKEMVIPYNSFGLTSTLTSKEIVGPRHVNPSAVRYEKHRVWVVDSIRKPDARHAYSRRTFYVEEDCWCIVATESYDDSGQLWRTTSVYTFPTYDTGGVNNGTFTTNDFVKGTYFVVNTGRADPGNFVRSYADHKSVPMLLTPQAVAAGNVR